MKTIKKTILVDGVENILTNENGYYEVYPVGKGLEADTYSIFTDEQVKKYFEMGFWKDVE